MNRVVVIVGASGHGHVIADIVRANGDVVLGFLDDDRKKDTIGTVADWVKYQEHEFVIGIGNSDIREKISKSLGVRWYTAIHPSAVVSPQARIDEGTVVMPNVVINAGAQIGKHSIINSGSIVEHDNKIGDYSHISVGVKLGGTVNIGDKTWVGIGATVCNNIKICKNCMIGAGAVVVNDICDSATYAGLPAVKILPSKKLGGVKS